ncbi:hypothetical protein RSAG8_11622, partial [Rhizoctonia solani AG-8 WAC10335]
MTIRRLLNESSQRLQEDYTETSAKTLSLISQTLLVIANNQPNPEISTRRTTIQPFRPRKMDVYVNALWFTSLSLSVLVSFISILAKEWCFNFISGNPDEPHPQARKRQIRWNGITKWRMKQLMVILPPIMHLALLMFTAGLCINLWSVNFSVALPVAVISLGIMLVYALSTSCFQKSKAMEDDYFEQDKITSQSIAWLIKSSKNRGSVDTALQSIAGADKNLPRQPLLRCGAINLITTRLKVLGNDCAKDQTRAYIRDLYIRALRFLESPLPSNQSEREQADLESKLKSKIRYLRSFLESTITRRVAASNAANGTLTNDANVRALRAATRALSESLWVRDRGVDNHPGQLSALEDITNQLELYDSDPDTLHPASGLAVVVGAATLYSCMSRNNHSNAVVRCVLRALPEGTRLPNQYLGMILAPFALSRHGSSNPQIRHPFTETNQALTAVKTIIFYLPALGTLDESTAATMIEFGLAHLLHNSTTYNLSAQDLARIRTAFTRLPNNNSIQMAGLPADFSVRQYALNGIALLPTQEIGRGFHSHLFSSESIHALHNVSRTITDPTGFRQSVEGGGMVSSNPSTVTNGPEYAELAIRLLQKLGNGPHPVAEHCLVVALAHLFPKFLPDCDASTTMELAALLLAENNQIRNQHLGLLLAVFVLSIGNHAFERAPGQLEGSASTSRALGVANYYIPLLNQPDNPVANVMINFALSEILNISKAYGQRDIILESVYASFKRLALSDYHITTFEWAPLDLNIHNHTAEALNQVLLSANDQNNVSVSQIAALRHLNALRQIYYSGRVAASLSEDASNSNIIPPEVHTLASSISSLKLFTESRDRVPASVGFSFVVGAVTLFSSAAADCTTLIAAKYVRRTLLNSHEMPSHYREIISMVFTLAWGDTALSSQSTALDATTSFSQLRAIGWVTEYARASEGHRNSRPEAINLGATVLLISSNTYQIPAAEVEELYQTFLPLPSNRSALNLYPLSPDFDIDQFMMNALTHRLISICKQRDVTAAEAAATIHLRALGTIYTTQLGAFPTTSSLANEIGAQNNGKIPLLEHALAQLDRVKYNPVPLHPAAVHSLAIGGAILLSILLPDCSPETASRLVLQLLAGKGQLSHECLGVLLLGFALSRNNPPGWSGPPLHPRSRVIRALDAITHYAPELGNLHRDQSAIMMNIGLLELLLNSRHYNLSEQDLTTIHKVFAPIHEAPASHPIHQLPLDFDIRSYILEGFTQKLSASHDLTRIDLNEGERVTRQDNKLYLSQDSAQGAIVNQTGSSAERDDPFLMSWDDPDNHTNPRNWGKRRRWFITVLGCVAMLNVLFLVGYGTGTLIWSYLSGKYGRRPVLLLGSAGYTAFQIGTALAPNIGTLLAFRLLGGAFAACLLTVSRIIIIDIWSDGAYDKVFAVFNFSLFMSPILGPIVAGYMSVAGADWRWIFRGLAVFAGLYTIVLTLILPETSERAILRKRAARLRRSTGDEQYPSGFERRESWTEIVEFLLKELITSFREPEPRVSMVYMTFIYGCVYLPLAAYPIVFTQGHNLNAGVSGLMYLPLLGGEIAGVAIYIIVFNLKNMRFSRKFARRISPSDREYNLLDITIWAAPLYAISFFWFGWTSYPSISYLAPAFSGILSGFSVALIVLSLYNHVVDSYEDRGAIIMMVSLVVQSAFAGGFIPLATMMYERLNPRIASTILGAIAVAMVPILFALKKFNSWFRAHSRYWTSEVQAYSFDIDGRDRPT